MLLERTTSKALDDRFSESRSPRPEPSLAGVFEAQPCEALQAGAGLFWEGDPAGHVFQVIEGTLRLFRLLADGRRIITGFVCPGDLIGVSLRDRYLYSAEAVTDVRLRRFSRTRFDGEIERSPALRTEVFAWLCDEMAAAQDQMVLLGRKNAEERVCSFLLLVARRMRRGEPLSRRFEIPMSRLDMADYLGLTIETVSRTMSRLTAQGVIAARGRHGIEVCRLETLVFLAGGDMVEDEPSSGPAKREAAWKH